MRNKVIFALAFLALMCSCDFVSRSHERIFNRYRVRTPSMSPALNAGETYRACSSTIFQVNQIVIYNAPATYPHVGDDQVWAHRLIGMPGDTVEMKSGKLFVNGQPYPHAIALKHSYTVTTSMPLNEKRMEGFEYARIGGDDYQFHATDKQLQVLMKNSAVIDILSGVYQPGELIEQQLLRVIGANRDNWGPVRIPKRGDEVALTEENSKQYESVIGVNRKVQAGEKFLIDKDHYFVLGDNRHNSLDSRYLGFIAQDKMKGVLNLE